MNLIKYANSGSNSPQNLRRPPQYQSHWIRDLHLNLPDLVKKSSRSCQGQNRHTRQGSATHCHQLQVLCIKIDSIFPLAMAVNTFTKTTIDLKGGVFLKFVAYNIKTGNTKSTIQLYYVSQSVKGIYLSERACIDFGICADHISGHGRSLSYHWSL